MRTHSLHGLRIRSPLPLDSDRTTADERHALEHDGEPADLTVDLAAPGRIGPHPPPGDLLDAFVLGDVPVYTAAVENGIARLRVHGLCDFEVGVGPGCTEASCRPDSDASLGHVALVARGAFLAFWLGLRGDCVLHASAVERQGRSVVFVGGSGMGKSTMAAWTCAAGARFICDDLLRINRSDAPRWIGRSPELRLRPSAEELVRGRQEQWHVRPSVDARLAALPPVSDEADGVIGAVVVPQPTRDAAGLKLERVDPVDAVLILASFPRLEGWRLPAAVEAQLDGAARIAAAAPVYVATVPWGPPFPVSLGEELLRRTLDSSEAPTGVRR